MNSSFAALSLAATLLIGAGQIGFAKEAKFEVKSETAQTAQAELSPEDFVQANIISYFYHELGHAVIDIEQVPVFGQEEDAADVFSIFMIDEIFEEQDAVNLAYDTAFGFLIEAEASEQGKNDVPWWDTHGQDKQRFFNTICLFYGANPDERADFAHDMDLPEERAERCPGEFDLADQSWGPIIDDLKDKGPGTSIKFVGSDDSLTGDILKTEVDELNKLLTLSEPLVVTMENCGEANAYYYPDENKISFCTELESHLFELAEDL